MLHALERVDRVPVLRRARCRHLAAALHVFHARAAVAVADGTAHEGAAERAGHGGAVAAGHLVAQHAADGKLVDLLASDPADHAQLASRWDAFTPSGEVELWAGFELPEPPQGVAASLSDLRFAAEGRMNGKAGLAYKGWPLYLWIKDAKPGDMTGDGVGGTWHTAVEAM